MAFSQTLSGQSRDIQPLWKTEICSKPHWPFLSLLCFTHQWWDNKRAWDVIAALWHGPTNLTDFWHTPNGKDMQKMAAGNEVESSAEALRLDCRTSFPGGSSFECYSLASLILLSNLVLHPFPFHNCTSTSTSDWEQQFYIDKKPSFPYECSNWSTGLF